MGCLDLIDRGATCFPTWVLEEADRRSNLTATARRYLERMGACVEDLFHHTLARSAARGRAPAALLDPETPVPGITKAPLRSEAAAIAVPVTTSGRHMTGDDFALTAGWGHLGPAAAVMPGQGRAIERPYTPEERATLAPTPSTCT